MMPTKKLLLTSVLCCVFLGIGCAINAVAPSPTPNLLAKRQAPGQITLAIQGATNEPLCSETEGLKDFCVENLKTALTDGLSTLTQEFFSGEGPRLASTFKLVEFSHDFGSAVAQGVSPAVVLSMRWQFAIRDAAGEAVFTRIGRTNGPTALVNVNQAESAVLDLLNAVIEEISLGLNSEGS